MITASTFASAAVAWILAGVLLERGYVQSAGAFALAGVLTTAGATAVAIAVSLLYGAEATLLLLGVLTSGVLSALAGAGAFYGTNRGWRRRGLFAVAGILALGLAPFGFPFTLLTLFMLMVAAIYLGLAITNPALIPSEA